MRLHKSLSRTAEGSSNRDKARVKVARAHATVADSRRDFHHKTSTAIIRDNQAVYAEDLCVTGLARTPMAKSVHDAGWSAFVTMLEYKAERYGRYFGKIGPVRPVDRAMLGLRRQQREQAAARPPVGLRRVRHGP